MISSILTYVGTTFLSVFLFYKSWILQKIDFDSKKLNIDSSFLQACEEDYWEDNLGEKENQLILYGGEKSEKYFCFEIVYTNYSKTEVRNIIPHKIFIKYKNEVLSIENDIQEGTGVPFPIQYKEKLSYCYKIDKKILTQSFIKNEKPVIYIISNCVIDEFNKENISINIIRFDEECILSSIHQLRHDFIKKYGNIGTSDFFNKINKEYEI